MALPRESKEEKDIAEKDIAEKDREAVIILRKYYQSLSISRMMDSILNHTSSIDAELFRCHPELINSDERNMLIKWKKATLDKAMRTPVENLFLALILIAVEREQREAIPFLQSAAESIPYAKVALADIYEKMFECDKRVVAKKLMEEACAANDPIALSRHALTLPRDVCGFSAKFFLLSAETGNKEAFARLVREYRQSASMAGYANAAIINRAIVNPMVAMYIYSDAELVMSPSLIYHIALSTCARSRGSRESVIKAFVDIIATSQGRETFYEIMRQDPFIEFAKFDIDAAIKNILLDPVMAEDFLQGYREYLFQIQKPGIISAVSAFLLPDVGSIVAGFFKPDSSAKCCAVLANEFKKLDNLSAEEKQFIFINDNFKNNSRKILRAIIKTINDHKTQSDSPLSRLIPICHLALEASIPSAELAELTAESVEHSAYDAYVAKSLAVKKQ